MFDNNSIEQLGFYVYALIHPETNKPFYIGKGSGNRIFNHKSNALKTDNPNLRLDAIRNIIDSGLEVKHIILRHGLNEKEAFEVEASLIDFGKYIGLDTFNIVEGHHTFDRGLMTSDEVIRRYNAKPLEVLIHPVIIININKKYKKGQSIEAIYESTKQAWVVGAKGRHESKFALAEYRGIIIEVFEIKEWYPVQINGAKIKFRWGFNGIVAKAEIRDVYVNKSIAHTKKPGASNPIKYIL
ncbi:hypothetical protein FEE95_03165 [Maribacter algarum]|uniref:GIY-YIG domain-containing protein n=1 Tax=Maribacter algarum (ex Zhang et al. 2020) TaxID=2578118 RepID=A0A5S3PTY5_9FLAO|nr:hypothetical protein [Maribacter algarum]TMM58445.1 hypothetical protein FEE95_03165 [Maribacter algarum]